MSEASERGNRCPSDDGGLNGVPPGAQALVGGMSEELMGAEFPDGGGDFCVAEAEQQRHAEPLANKAKQVRAAQNELSVRPRHVPRPDSTSRTTGNT